MVPCNVHIDWEETWCGFVYAIQNLFEDNDKVAKARFNKINENVEE